MPQAHTEFAPAGRASPEELQRQRQHIASSPQLATFLDYVPDMVLILNAQRQIAYANRGALQFAGGVDAQLVAGLRPGDLFSCKHARESESGCGTTRFCRHCGAVAAILQSQSGHPATEECRITCAGEPAEEALDLRVWTTPVRVQGEPFTFYAVVNIADEKRRRFLERIFLHDVMNTATALRGLSSLLQSGDETVEPEVVRSIAFLSEWISEEIAAQRQLVAAENGELETEVTEVSSRRLLQAVVAAYSRPELLNGRHLTLGADAQDVTFESDSNLLRRVLGNMVKNAIEGSAPGELVTVTCFVRGETIALTVHNPTYMPENVRLQVFNRSFSTKGAGRGLGTYSMKYLTEKYLHGNVSFVSDEREGTTFTAAYPLRRAT